MIGKRFRNLSIVLATFTVAGSCSSASPPASPSAPTPTSVTGVIIDGVPDSPAFGDSAQLVAKVVLENGVQKQLADPAWKSSDPSIVSVAPSGMVTFVSVGTSEITVSSGGLFTSAAVHVTTTITGVVHESAPTENVLLPGATVDVQGCPTCPAESRRVITDDTGRFALRGVDVLGFSVSVVKPGYLETTHSVTQLPRDQHLDFSLTADDETFKFEGRVCSSLFGYQGGQQFSCEAYPKIVHHTMSVHRPGRRSIRVNWTYSGDYSADMMTFEIRCGGQSVIQKTLLLLPAYLPPPSLSLSLVPCDYDVSLSNFTDNSKAAHPQWTPYRIDVQRER
jgi:hypothetical protein